MITNLCSDKLDLCRDYHKFNCSKKMGFSERIASEIMFKSTIPIMEICSKAQYQCKNYKRNVYSKDPSQVAIGPFNIAFSVPFQH